MPPNEPTETINLRQAMNNPQQSRMPTILACIALALAVYNGSRITEEETATRYSVTDLQAQVDSHAEDIEILTTELARVQQALLTMGETTKTTNTLIDVLREERNQ